MTTLALKMETSRIDAHTRRFIGVSLLFHVILFLCLLFYQHYSPAAIKVTEITWLEPSDPKQAPPAPVKVEPKPQPTKSMKSEQRFEREQSEADIAPQPQTSVVEDRLRRQLAALQKVEKARPLEVASVSPTASAWNRTQPSVPTTTRSDEPAIELRREAAGTAPAIELKRQTQASNLSKLAEIPDRVLTPKEAAPETSELAQRSLAGNSLVGPAADRPLQSYTLPHYPDWAKREGVEASVSLYFLVSAGGRVKENVLVQKTSGFEDFDREARRALLTWRFEPLPSDTRGDQWGTITFNFRLKDMR